MRPSFHLSGYVNQQNFEYWAKENPYLLHQSPQCSEKVIIWCGVIWNLFWEHTFFEDNKGRAVTVTFEHYLPILSNNYFLQPILKQQHIGLWLLRSQKSCFISQGTTHNENCSTDNFPGHLITRNGNNLALTLN